MPSHSIRKPSISIRLKIPLLIVTPLITAIVLTGWLAFRNGQREVDNLAKKLSSKISTQIELNVQAYFNKSQLIHQVNAAAIRSGSLNVENFQQLESYFWNQIQQGNLLSSIYFGNEQGDFIYVERLEDGTTVLRVKDKSTGAQRKTYTLDSQGKRGKLTASQEYDPRTRPWYVTAKEAGKGAWSPIYKFASQPIPGITSVMPILDQGTLRGILGSDLSLKRISEFLSKLEISKSGKAFIIERSGEIVASSIPDTRFINFDGRLLQATDSSQPLIIKSTAQHLREKFGSLDRIDGKQPLSSFSLDGSNQLVNVARLQDDWGLDWLIVVVIPEADFMDEFNSAALFTLFVGLAVAGVAAFLGLIAAQRIIQPIFTITDVAAAIEAGRFELKSLEAVAKRDDELGQLARIFQHMAVEIYDREQHLKQQVQELDQEIGKFKNDKQVVGLNETNYFVDLLQKARNLRTQTKERGR